MKSITSNVRYEDPLCKNRQTDRRCWEQSLTITEHFNRDILRTDYVSCDHGLSQYGNWIIQTQQQKQTNKDLVETAKSSSAVCTESIKYQDGQDEVTTYSTGSSHCVHIHNFG